MRAVSMRNNLLLVLTAAIWGFAFVAQSVGMDYVGPFTFTASRSLIAGVVLLIFMALSPSRKRKGGGKAQEETPAGAPASSVRLLVTGGIACGLCLTAASGFQQIGINYTTVGKAGFITAMYIVIVPILGLFTGKKVRILSWISVVLGVIGLYLLCMTESLALGRGDLLVLICAFCFSLHILTIDHFSPKVDCIRMSCIQFFTCGIISGIIALIFESPNIRSILAAWIPILYAGALSSAVGYTLQIVAQKNTDPVIASLIMSLESVFSVLAGWILLHQYLSGRELLGCLVMFSAIILTQLPGRRPKAK